MLPAQVVVPTLALVGAVVVPACALRGAGRQRGTLVDVVLAEDAGVAGAQAVAPIPVDQVGAAAAVEAGPGSTLVDVRLAVAPRVARLAAALVGLQNFQTLQFVAYLLRKKVVGNFNGALKV